MRLEVGVARLQWLWRCSFGRGRSTHRFKAERDASRSLVRIRSPSPESERSRRSESAAGGPAAADERGWRRCGNTRRRSGASIIPLATTASDSKPFITSLGRFRGKTTCAPDRRWLRRRGRRRRRFAPSVPGGREDRGWPGVPGPGSIWRSKLMSSRSSRLTIPNAGSPSRSRCSSTSTALRIIGSSADASWPGAALISARGSPNVT